ncbi:pyrroloquinoline quinone biosynthesis peptide chaperone PqqD [Microbulbifer sp.]|uniref:pyrroloquinoline quinone biosynthesis peptide chaperone PqqD n=1 Tax=Microbulbifer sp. TaxID=1908541 RepID=UPI003F3AC58F
MSTELDRFLLNPRYRLQWEEAQGCHILLYPEGLVRLSESAAEILKRCHSPTTRAALVADLQRKFPGAETLSEDVAEFLQQARQREWIQRAGD